MGNKKTLIIELGKKPEEGIKTYEELLSLEQLFKDIGFQEVPPLGFQCKIMGIYMMVKTPFYTLVVFEVDWANPGQPANIGLMSRMVITPGSVALVRSDKNEYAFIRQERFLFGLLEEAVRGFGQVKQELGEELDIKEQESEPKVIGRVRSNTGLTMTTAPDGATPIYVINVKTKPGVGRGEYTEKIAGVKFLSLAKIREKYLNGEITDPWFAFGLLLLLMEERPDVFN